MKIEALKNGDLIVSTGTKPIFVILGILAFLFLSKEAYLWLLVSTNIRGDRLVAVLVLVLAIALFYRAFSLRSYFIFSGEKKQLTYSSQYFFSNKTGEISIELITEATLENGGDNNSRIVLVCKNRKIPMTATVTSLGRHESIADEINQWLTKNKST